MSFASTNTDDEQLNIKSRAWRTLGLFIRVVSELELHCIDDHHEADEVKIKDWLACKEKRCAFWAVWELRNLPGTHSNSSPRSDDFWLQRVYQPSSFLHPAASVTYQLLVQTYYLSTTA